MFQPRYKSIPVQERKSAMDVLGKLEAGEILARGTQIPGIGKVVCHQCFEHENEECVGAGVWYVVQRSKIFRPINDLQWYHERSFIEILSKLLK